MRISLKIRFQLFFWNTISELMGQRSKKWNFESIWNFDHYTTVKITF
jgi:hypothetical protein